MGRGHNYAIVITVMVTRIHRLVLMLVSLERVTITVIHMSYFLWLLMNFPEITAVKRLMKVINLSSIELFIEICGTYQLFLVHFFIVFVLNWYFTHGMSKCTKYVLWINCGSCS
jgi:hypothetical protein